jgi:hypothetical protein
MDFRIIRGAPTDEEITALATALAQIESTHHKDETAEARKHRWGAPKLRGLQVHGINGWRRSLR